MNHGNTLTAPCDRLGRAKLNAESVHAIRRSGEHRRKLAAKYHVTPQSIDNIRARRTWWHV